MNRRIHASLATRSSIFVLAVAFTVSCQQDDLDESGDGDLAGGDGDSMPKDGDSVSSSGGSSAASGVGGQPGSSSGGVDGGAVGGTGGDTLGSGACDVAEPLPLGAEFSCGAQGHVLRNQGPHENRVNYVLVGDGYTSQMLDGLFIDHIQNMLDHEDGMFGDLGEPYRTYERFINICALKVASQDACIDDLDSGLECDTAFNGYGDDASRLGIVDGGSVRNKVGELMPDEVDVDWIAVSINAGASNWWNSGGSIMVFNGGFSPASRAASVALHEGGHAFHGLADEYDGTSGNCGSAPEVNVSTDDSGAKWAEWLGFDHNPGTGPHGSYEGARYCMNGIYRPTDNSEMNLLPDYFNMPSMQKMIHDIYEVVEPIDAHTSNQETIVSPAPLQVSVVDPEVVLVEWSVDGTVVTENGGGCFPTDGLTTGTHTVTARAYDPTEWVRDERGDLEQSVTWTVSVP